MKLKHKFKGLIILLTLFLLSVTVFGGLGNLPASAVTYDNSDVLKDLRTDSSFNVDDFPISGFDYGIYVIQIGESEKGNLYVYTYQPCQPYHKFVATDINMSLSETVDGTKLYELVLVNSNDVFAKYLVKDVKVSGAQTRYYNVTSIYRAWDIAFDKETGNNNTIDKVAFNVHNIYKATTENGEIKYSCEPTYVVNIIDPYSDFLTYAVKINPPHGVPSIDFSMHSSDVIDAHYVAFSTDWEIDKLKSATVSYSYCSGKTKGDKFLFWELGKDTTYGSEQRDYAYPTYLDKFEVTDSRWKRSRNKYSWDRIQTVTEFITNEPDLTEETKGNLSGKQWVLRFLETDRSGSEVDILGYRSGTVNFTKVDKVAVLRLEFETDGVTYNLGAVSDMVSGDELPGNVEPKPEEKSFWDKVAEFFEKLLDKVKGIPWWQWVLIGLGLLLGVGLIVAIVKFGVQAVFSFIWWLIKKLFKGLWWLITLPFRLISKAVKNRKEKE